MKSMWNVNIHYNTVEWCPCKEYYYMLEQHEQLSSASSLQNSLLWNICMRYAHMVSPHSALRDRGRCWPWSLRMIWVSQVKSAAANMWEVPLFPLYFHSFSCYQIHIINNLSFEFLNVLEVDAYILRSFSCPWQVVNWNEDELRKENPPVWIFESMPDPPAFNFVGYLHNSLVCSATPWGICECTSPDSTLAVYRASYLPSESSALSPCQPALNANAVVPALPFGNWTLFLFQESSFKYLIIMILSSQVIFFRPSLSLNNYCQVIAYETNTWQR